MFTRARIFPSATSRAYIHVLHMDVSQQLAPERTCQCVPLHSPAESFDLLASSGQGNMYPEYYNLLHMDVRTHAITKATKTVKSIKNFLDVCTANRDLEANQINQLRMQTRQQY